MPLEAGRRLGLFEVVSPLGAGGMGEVYRARDTRLCRDVALKVLPEAVANRPERRTRFEREARALAVLSHPGIAGIHEVGEAEGVTFLVLELVEGRSLADRLKRGSLPVREALDLARQIAEALEAAHERGLVHRDLKPSNVMVTAAGRVKLLDFGLAKALEDEASHDSRLPTATATSGGLVMGTGPYMSPEQARGETVDRRTDIWAFGCVLYEMLTSRRAFPGPTPSDSIAAVLGAEPDWSVLPEGTPALVRSVLRRCLQKDRALRIHDVADARLEILEASEARPDPDRRHGSRPGRRQAGSVLAGFAVLTLAGWLTHRGLARPEAPRSGQLRHYSVPTTSAAPLSTDAYLPFDVSSDGQRLVYAANTEGPGLYVRDLDQSEARALPGTKDAYEPFFSPDGEWVAFWSSRGLRKLPLDGRAAPTLICEAEDVLGAVWAADGTIVFAPSERGVLQRVSADGGVPQPLTRLEPGEASHLWPELLPRGEGLLFTVQTASGDTRIAAQSLATGARRVIVEGGTRARYAPTGHIVYARAGVLFAAPFDPRHLRLQGQPVPFLDGVAAGPIGNAQFAFSSDGSLFYNRMSRAPKRRLLLVDRRGLATPLPGDPGPYSFPAVSPGGGRIALEVGDDQRENLWIYDLAAGRLTRLTSFGRNLAAAWTPDGQTLTFASGTTALLQVLSQRADGSEAAERLVESEGFQAPNSWSPDGQRLVLVRASPAKDAEIYSVQTGREPELLVSAPGKQYSARVSPNGKWLAYVSDESGSDEILLRPFPGPGSIRQLTSEGGREPRWSRNGSELFYRAHGQLMSIRIDPSSGRSSGPPKPLFEDRYDRVSGLGYDVMPDGRFVMVEPDPDETLPGAIHVITGWFDRLRSAVPR
jgi:serine/threonine-protein kinase